MIFTAKRCRAFLLASLALSVSACGNDVKESLGLARQAPDEFTVVSRPALSVPPDFTLRPPEPGAPPRQTPTDEQAHNLLLGHPTSLSQNPALLTQPTVDTAVTPVITTSQPTGAESSFLKRAGADASKDDIRSQLRTDEARPVDTSGAKSLLEKVQSESKDEPTVDAKKEAERLRSNKDEGKPATEGDVPIEDNKPASTLDKIRDIF